MGSLTSPGLIKAANEALVKAQPEINMVKLFAYDMSDEFSGYGYTVKVPLINHGEISAFSDANDYETTDGTVTYIPVALDTQYKSTFEFNGQDVLEAPNAPYWNKCAEAAAAGITDAISQKVGGLFTTTALTSNVVLSGDISKKKLAALRTNCAGRVADTVLALSPAYFAEALALFDSNVYGNADAIQNGKIDGLYGFKAVIQLKDLPQGVNGALIPSNAIAVASRAVAVGDESCFREIGNASDENGFTLTVMRHGSAAKGKGFLNVTTLMGAKIVQADKIKLLTAE